MVLSRRFPVLFRQTRHLGFDRDFALYRIHGQDVDGEDIDLEPLGPMTGGPDVPDGLVGEFNMLFAEYLDVVGRDGFAPALQAELTAGFHAQRLPAGRFACST